MGIFDSSFINENCLFLLLLQSQTQQVKMAEDNDIQLIAKESFNDDPTLAITNLKVINQL